MAIRCLRKPSNTNDLATFNCKNYAFTMALLSIDIVMLKANT